MTKTLFNGNQLHNQALYYNNQTQYQLQYTMSTFPLQYSDVHADQEMSILGEEGCGYAILTNHVVYIQSILPLVTNVPF